MPDDTETPKTEPAADNPQPEPEVAEAKPNGPPPPQWEYRTNMKVTERLKHVVNLTIDVSKAEITRLRKQIDKLTYGS
jgi:hypothetical protein